MRLCSSTHSSSPNSKFSRKSSDTTFHVSVSTHSCDTTPRLLPPERVMMGLFMSCERLRVTSSSMA